MERFVWYDLYDSYSVLKSKELSHSTICMMRLDDSNILLYKFVYLNFLISVSTESTMSKELAPAAIVIEIISKVKNTGRKRKQRTVWVETMAM